jgi:3-deoxy-D-manno-octulosonate 8-phosphate phosphatase (KDO 8-P phosphatase)
MTYWKEIARQIKIVLMDCDGVLTDTGMYYGPQGDMMKRFSTHDGLGIKLLQKAGIKSGIITGETTPHITHRAEKLKMDYVCLGSADKLKAAQDICEKENISLAEIAFIGDDINDMGLLKAAGLSACPPNARPQVKSLPGILHLQTKGGEGAVRELCDFILDARGFELFDLHEANIQ